MLSEVKSVVGRGVPVVGNDIDTDRIIPARFLKCVTFDGLGQYAFADDRVALAGQHSFDLPQYQGSSILVTNNNFGCGSSREHAPQAISKWGIKAIIGESFAEIFFGNCIALGIPCVIVTHEISTQIQALITENPMLDISLDLVAMTMSCGDLVATIVMNEGARQMFVTGHWDATGQLVAQANVTRAKAQSLPYVKWQLQAQ
ncbi:MAG: 3-isopropylmalate dehydratase small subunit [Cyanobacteria bacterium]|nr:3-isopropylmalate dehydratase small subunit [Cyanobacteriota bacterium]